MKYIIESDTTPSSSYQEVDTGLEEHINNYLKRSKHLNTCTKPTNQKHMFSVNAATFERNNERVEVIAGYCKELDRVVIMTKVGGDITLKEIISVSTAVRLAMCLSKTINDNFLEGTI